MGWRTTRAGRVGTGDCGGIEEVAALVRTDWGNGVREEKRETEIGRVSGGEGEKRIIRERREWLAWWSIVHDALRQRGNVVEAQRHDPLRQRTFRLVYKRLALGKLTPLHFRRSQRTSLGEVVANQRPSFRGPRPQADSTSPVPNVGCRR